MILTLVEKNKGPLTKIIRLDGNGGIEKDSSECWLNEGKATQIDTTLEKLAKLLRKLKQNQALIHGINGHKQINILSKKKYTGQANTITRTKEHFSFVKGEGSAFFDHDPKPGQKAYSNEDFMRIMAEVFPAISGMANVCTPSTSSCIYKDGEQLVGQEDGMHIYFAVKDATDLPRFSKVLLKRLWLAGHGYIFITKDGKQLERTIFDKAVFSPERLDFVAGAVCKDGLEQRLPDPVYTPGNVLDTSLLKDLTEDEEVKYQRLVDEAKGKSLTEAVRIRGQYVMVEVEKLIKAGIPQADAKRIIEKRIGGDLIEGDNLYFDRVGKTTVKQVLKDPEKFDRETLLDPLEPGYGPHKAIFYANIKEGKPVVYSQAHGGRTFFLQHGGDYFAVEPQEKKKSATQLIIETIKEKATLLHDLDDTPFARSDHGEHKELWPLESQQFKRWMGRTLYERHKLAPNKNSLADALNVLAGIAIYDGKEISVHVRVAEVDGTYFLDLCRDDWRIIKIEPGKWRITSSEIEGVAFRRTSTMRALPVPENCSYEILPGLLTRHLNMSEHHARLIIAYLLECLMPDTEYPILEITGSPGSGKSTIQEMLRDCIDPNKVNLRAAPKTVEDIFVSAINNHLVSYNNLSRISGGQSDALCSLSTGGGHAGRRFFTNTDETATDVKKPVVLNGISHLAKMPDLIDRLIKISLQPISSKENKPKKQVMDSFNSDLPKILGALLDLFSKVLELLPGIKLERLPRMADFAKLCEASTHVYKWEKGLLQIYYENREISFRESLETSPAIMAVVNIVKDQGSYKGTVGDLYEEIESQRKERDAWIKSPRGLGERLRLHTPALAAIGINVDFDTVRHNDGYHVILTKMHDTGGEQHSQHSQRSQDQHPNLHNREGREGREHVTQFMSRTQSENSVIEVEI